MNFYTTKDLQHQKTKLAAKLNQGQRLIHWKLWNTSQRKKIDTENGKMSMFMNFKKKNDNHLEVCKSNVCQSLNGIFKM